jgi:hypothetical protein
MDRNRKVPEDPDALITIRTFLSPVEAEWAQAVLTSASVCSFIPDRNVNFGFNFIGGVRLQVPASKADEAEEILSQSEFEQHNLLSEQPEEDFSVDGEDALADENESDLPVDAVDPEDVCPMGRELERCPACGSDEVGATVPPDYVVESQLKTLLRHFRGHGWLKCNACGHTWDDSEG